MLPATTNGPDPAVAHPTPPHPTPRPASAKLDPEGIVANRPRRPWSDRLPGFSSPNPRTCRTADHRVATEARNPGRIRCFGGHSLNIIDVFAGGPRSADVALGTKQSDRRGHTTLARELLEPRCDTTVGGVTATRRPIAVLFDSGGVLMQPIGGRWNPRADFEQVLTAAVPTLTAEDVTAAIAVGDAFLNDADSTPA